MNNLIVRIENITINNFKNIENGTVSLINSRVDSKSNVLGIYGQNGSGKTALIDAVELLKLILMGSKVPNKYNYYINVNSESATFKFDIKISDVTKKESFLVNYEFSIKKDEVLENSINVDNEKKENINIVVFNEKISFSVLGENNEKILNKELLVDTNTSKITLPKTKYDVLTNYNKDLYTDLLVAKKIAYKTSSSFLFSREYQTIINENCKEEKYLFIFKTLINYGHFNLFVINATNIGLLGLNVLPLTFKYEDGLSGVIGRVSLPLEKSTVIPKGSYEVVKNVVKSMNIVLKQLVPNLEIYVKELGLQSLEDGREGVAVELFSSKNSKLIPLRCESDGIKKIISILQLLIVVYNQPSVTVAIDEIDAGVFEYLLGELLRILSEKGKGQLIFTSHNLRVLETLDKGCIVFTTTNKNNRYIRLNNVKTNNNLRDFYYRDIVLGEQKEEVYEMTNNYEISLAFREAGDFDGT